MIYLYMPKAFVDFSKLIDKIVDRMTCLFFRFAPQTPPRIEPPKLLMPEYRDKQNQLVVTDLSKQMKFLSHFSQLAEAQRIMRIVQSVPQELVITNLTDPTTLVPNATALERKAKHYYDKYGIEIHVVQLNDLKATCARLCQSNNIPKYLGIIVLANDVRDLHVVPVVVYLGAQPEAIVMDVIISSALSVAINNILKDIQFALPYNLTQTVRQADRWSCRTAAITLLRNALLEIKFYKRMGGFVHSLERRATTFALPSSWTYTEQIFDGDVHGYVIRRFFSAKPAKRLQMQAIHEFRQLHTGEIHLRYSVNEISFIVSQRVNRYLIDKARKNQTQLLAPPQGAPNSILRRRSSNIIISSGERR